MQVLKSWRKVRLSLVRERAEHGYGAIMRTGRDVAALVRQFIGDDPREHFVAVYLDTRHRPIAVHDVAIGSVAGCTVTPAGVFGPALQLAATAIVVAHNHPSGDPTPSPEDHAITERLRAGAEILGQRLLDHVIIGADHFYTFSDERSHPW